MQQVKVHCIWMRVRDPCYMFSFSFDYSILAILNEYCFISTYVALLSHLGNDLEAVSQRSSVTVKKEYMELALFKKQ